MNSYFVYSTNYYNEYKDVGITDDYIKHKFQYSDAELDRLMFTNYEKYKLLMEKDTVKNVTINHIKKLKNR